jgi:hypothetical protein
LTTKLCSFNGLKFGSRADHEKYLCTDEYSVTSARFKRSDPFGKSCGCFWPHVVRHVLINSKSRASACLCTMALPTTPRVHQPACQESIICKQQATLHRSISRKIKGSTNTADANQDRRFPGTLAKRKLGIATQSVALVALEAILLAFSASSPGLCRALCQDPNTDRCLFCLYIETCQTSGFGLASRAPRAKWNSEPCLN